MHNDIEARRENYYKLNSHFAQLDDKKNAKLDHGRLRRLLKETGFTDPPPAAPP